MREALESISPRAVTPLAPATGTQAFARSDREDREQRLARSAGGDAPRTGGNAVDDPAGVADSLRLSPEARSQLRELKQRDAEVRAHERAHTAAGGEHVTGGASYTYQKGPDGRQYAIGGHVAIDASAVPGDPEATEEKARQVRRAALAPGEPSGQDQQVAAKAAAMEAEARVEARSGEKGENGEEARVRGAASPDAIDPAFGVSDGPGDVADMRANIPANALEDAQSRLTRQALESYAAMSMRGRTPTALAPAGTGISLLV